MWYAVCRLLSSLPCSLPKQSLPEFDMKRVKPTRETVSFYLAEEFKCGGVSEGTHSFLLFF